MGNIVLLDELTINQIAAGEVIERPASVVKEMLENSIDAGAKHITVEIKNGGISFIRITDDGKGIQKDDVEMAFERHATSKIRSAEDLQDVKSMGFRGEALASIASIANVELVSRQESDEIGTRIVIEGGNVLSLDEIGCSKGTTITVRNLFYNTPVRYKFLKKDFTESGYIEDVITRIALIHPEVSIKFINTGKIAISTNGSGNIKDAIYNIFGKEVANSLINVEYEYEYIKIKGVIGKPNICRSNRSNQIFYVNSRYVKDKTLSSAVEQAFKGTLPFGKFPFLVLNVEMSPSKVDVNVHPAKLEVRFAEESLVFKAMYHAVKDSMINQDIEKENKEIDENQIKVKAFENEPIIEEKKESILEHKPSGFEASTKLELNGEDIINKLKRLQEELKNEAEKNPNIHLTDEYKKMTEMYDLQINAEKNNSEFKADNSEIKPEKDDNIKEVEEQEESTEVILQADTTEEMIEESNKEKESEEYNVEEISNENNLDETKENYIETDFIEELPVKENIEETAEEAKSEEVTEEKYTEKENTEEIIENEEEKDTELSFRQMYKKLFGKEPYGGRKVEKAEENKDFYTVSDEEFSQDNLSMFENEEEFNKPDYKYIGIAFDNFIIIELKNELYVMDQKLVNEKIMYEKIKNNFYNDETKDSQMLLLPDLIDLDTKQMDIAKDNMELFEKAGFTLEEFDESTIKLSGVPESCVNVNTEQLFKEILEEINQAPRNDEKQKEQKFIDAISSMVASTMPIKNEKEDIEELIEELLSLKNPFINGQGKPIVIKMTRYEIEKKFARK